MRHIATLSAGIGPARTGSCSAYRVIVSGWCKPSVPAMAHMPIGPTDGRTTIGLDNGSRCQSVPSMTLRTRFAIA